MRRLAHLFTATAMLTTAFVVVSITAPGAPVVLAADGYQPLPAPQRLLDTRAGASTADGEFAGGGAIGGGRTLELTVAGRVGLPAEPGSVVLNVTATGASRPGFVAAWPCNEDRPPTANLNYAPGQTIANSVIARADPDGKVCFFARSAVHLIVDASGYLPGDSFDALPAPERLADTRQGGGTVDGDHLGEGRRPARSTYRVQIAGRGSLPGDAGAVALNVTVTGPTDRGYLTVYPCDAEQPVAANLTYSSGQTIPNAVLTRLAPDGTVCIFTRAATDIVVDATGVLPAAVFTPLDAPARLADTRPGQATADGQYSGGGIQPAFGTLQLQVAGRVGIPDEVAGVVLNVTSTGSPGRGFVTAHPQGSQRPNAANLNFPGGVNVSNLVVAAVGDRGDVCLFTRGTTHLVVDVVGWVTGPSVAAGDSACPGRSTDEDVEALRNQHVRRADLQRAVGAEVIAVYVCEIPADSVAFPTPERHDRTSTDIAAWLNAEVSPYYRTVSHGRYSVQFVGAGSFALTATEGSGNCLNGATSRAGGSYTGAFGVDNTGVTGGFAGPGVLHQDPRLDRTVFEAPASASRRGGWLGGAYVSTRPNPAAFIHELGHMLHWPHSYIGPASEYDNPVDVMSRGQGWCDIPGGGGARFNCDPANTIAFNRFVAGWLAAGDVEVHRAGTVNYLLDRPNGSGIELLLLPDPAEPLSALTIEAKPAVGNDDFFERSGVAIHVVDQLTRTNEPFSGFSTGRRQLQAMGEPATYDHVIEVGESRTVHGVTITVIERQGDRFVVQVAGTYRTPAPEFFAAAGHHDTHDDHGDGFHREVGAFSSSAAPHTPTVR